MFMKISILMSGCKSFCRLPLLIAQFPLLSAARHSNHCHCGEGLLPTCLPSTRSHLELCSGATIPQIAQHICWTVSLLVRLGSLSEGSLLLSAPTLAARWQYPLQKDLGTESGAGSSPAHVTWLFSLSGSQFPHLKWES